MSCYCSKCDRHFTSWSTFGQHLQNSSMHQWCRRCSRAFNTQLALHQHFHYSSNHHICFHCDEWPDFAEDINLQQHLEGYHDIYDGLSNSSGSYIESDRKPYYVCDDCGIGFPSPNNLKMVCTIPLPLNLRLLDCSILTLLAPTNA